MSQWEGKNGPLLIAEIGGNHEGDFEYAKKLTNLAIESGADFVKFQIYTGDTLVSKVEGAQRNAHFKKFELTNDQHLHLAKMCKDNNVGYMASVWDPEAIDWIDDYISIYKIGSGDLTAYPVLAKTAEKNKPIIISTGLANEDEVVATVEYIKSVNSNYNETNLAILQCTSMYPIPFSDANLNVMGRLKELTGCSVGYSDHTEGSFALEIAVAMGAEVLEFHFTDSRENKTFRDHKVSLTKDEVIELIQRIKEIKELQGTSSKTPLEVEGDHVTSFRRAVYPNRDILQGEHITAQDLTVLRPNHGIDARDFDKLVGKTATKNLIAHQKLDWEDFK
ncbi:MAG: N-acetylneuraminate synthase family protein [bacterium]|nr:N-acetylneuraminate synthase family protein [bacterium]